MLGSWSFGDYFKVQQMGLMQTNNIRTASFFDLFQDHSCELAWQLLTEEYRLDPSRLYVTYFGGDASLGLKADTETRDIWLEIG